MGPAPHGTCFNNPLLIAPKKDAVGQKTLHRVCLDPRLLNKLLDDDTFPMPLIWSFFIRIRGAVIFSILDQRDAYHRFRIFPPHCHKTTFTWRDNQDNFFGAPYGIKSLPGIFQRVTQVIVGDLWFALGFQDDMFVFSSVTNEHGTHVNTLIKRLNDSNLVLNLDKCHFYCTEVVLLGFVINQYGHRVDPKKLMGMETWAPPTTGKQVQHYLGFFNYFREYVPLFATLAAPLDALRHIEDVTSRWTPREQQAFDSMKSLLASSQVLSYPDFDKPFMVATDASNVGLGAVLYQQTPDNGKIHWISFISRALQPSEKKYSVTKKELLAIVFALKKFHAYLWSNKFTLYTDHRALIYLHSQKSLNPMMTMWLDTLFDYDFTVVHRPGIRNILPDHLSRLFPEQAWEGQVVPTNPITKIGMLTIEQAERTDRQVVPEADQSDLLAKKHALGHFGADALVAAIHGDNLHWSTLRKDCVEYVKQCIDCQRYNITKKGYHPLKPIHAELPGDHMAMDLAGPFVTSDSQNHYIMVLIDLCTRFVFLTALPDKQAVTVAGALLKAFCIIGFPKILQSDNGTEFVNVIVKEMARVACIDHRLISPYHPRANGAAERYVGVTTNAICKQIHGTQKDWDKYLPIIQLAMNVKVVSLHGSSPFSLFFGRQFNGFEDFKHTESRLLTQAQLLERLEYVTQIVFPAISEKSKATQQQMVSRFRQHVKDNLFPDGAYVMTIDVTKSGKLSPKYEGPYKVVRRTKGGSYILQDNTGALLPRNYPPSALKLISQDPILAGTTYEVEAVLDHRGDGQKREYLVHWKGYSKTEDTWEPIQNFQDISVINDYWKRRSSAGTKD